MALTRSTVTPTPLSVGRFTLGAMVDTSRLGTVHRGREQLTEQLVSIHLVDPKLAGQPGLIEKLQERFENVRKYDHPNILRLPEIGEDRGRWYLVTEWVEGRSLGQMIDAHSRIPEETAIRILTQVAQAVDYCNVSGARLSCVTPANILVRNDGVVKFVAYEPAVRTTDARQRNKSDRVDPALAQLLAEKVTFSDVLRSLGATMFEAVTGQEWVPPPPRTEKRVRSRSSRSRARIAGLTERVEMSVRWATDYDPKKQPISCAEWVKMLRSKSRAPAAPKADIRPGGTESDDRRNFVRYSVGVGTCCFINTSLFGTDLRRDSDLGASWPLVVRDVSAGGIGILLARRCEPGTELAIELVTEADNSIRCLPVRVVRVHRDSMGHWVHGCEFETPLTSKELSAVLTYLGRVEPS